MRVTPVRLAVPPVILTPATLLAAFRFNSKPSVPKYVSVPLVMVTKPLPTPVASSKAPLEAEVPIVSEPPFRLRSEDLKAVAESAEKLVAVTVPLLMINPAAVFGLGLLLAVVSRLKKAAPKATVPTVLMVRLPPVLLADAIFTLVKVAEAVPLMLAALPVELAMVAMFTVPA